MAIRPTREEILAAISRAGSIRRAAPTLGVDERTVRRWLGRSQDPGEVAKSPMKILAIDIETRPNLAYVWDLWNQNISLKQLVESATMMCWGAKWLHGSVVEFRSEFHDGHDVMLDRAWSLMDAADVVLHYNGKRFDVPHLNREFAVAGMPPPSPFKQVDLLAAVKARFRFASNKLEHVAPQLGLEEKLRNDGFELWTRCMGGEREAWDQMRAYNVQDVELLEQLYDRLLPWLPTHPSHASMVAKDVCPRCGSEDLLPAGLAFLSTGQYPRFQCGECGAFSRATRRTGATGITAVTS